MKVDEVLNRAAYSAGVLLRDGAFSKLVVEWKPGESPVTNLDKAAELLIREAITKELGEKPNFIGEEYGNTQTGSRFTFRIDPIDGTKPFVRREFTSSVSIAAEIDGELRAGCVYDFMRNIMYSAGDGEPYIAYNGKQHEIIKKNPLKTTLVSTYDLKKIPGLDEAVTATGWKRSERIGSIALIMAQVAAGCYDGIIEGPKSYAPHDVAAGYWLLKQARLDVKTSNFESFDYKNPTKGLIALPKTLENELYVNLSRK